MDSQNASYNAGVTKGQTQEKCSNMMDRASNTAQSAQDSMHETGQQMKAKAEGAADAVKNAAGQQMMASAQGAAEAVKNATGMNKN
ncbi:hypothetical protein VNO80_08148 [Phaseolus coccineus]|uniref:Stress-induced protein KIN2-like n=1 Tax=Phaseolus coccineus TaxID=3886 RepID=A0AAN9NL16_PHACN